MFIIFGLIFNVNTKEGEKFLQADQIQQELADAEKDVKDTYRLFDLLFRAGVRKKAMIRVMHRLFGEKK